MQLDQTGLHYSLCIVYAVEGCSQAHDIRGHDVPPPRWFIRAFVDATPIGYFIASSIHCRVRTPFPGKSSQTLST